MEFIVSEIIIGSLVLVAGILIGFFIGKTRTPDHKKSQELEIQLRAEQNQLKNYKESVTTHFKDTADLIQTMTRSYENVYNHLAHSAHKLCDDELVRQQLQSLQQSLLEQPQSADEKITENETKAAAL